MQIQTTSEKALKRKYPEQVVLVTTRQPRGRANVMAVGWVAMASDEPPMFVLGIDAGAYTYRLIRATREFVVAFPNEQMGPAVLYAGLRHGHKTDKFAQLLAWAKRFRLRGTAKRRYGATTAGVAWSLATQAGVVVKAPLIANAVANFECKLVRIFKPGNCPLIIGRVVAAHMHRRASVRRLYTVGSGYRLAGVRIRKV